MTLTAERLQRDGGRGGTGRSIGAGDERCGRDRGERHSAAHGCERENAPETITYINQLSVVKLQKSGVGFFKKQQSCSSGGPRAAKTIISGLYVIEIR